MSKPVKDLIVAEYRKRFEGVAGAVLIEVRGMNASANNSMRLKLRKNSVRVTVVKNALARRAFAQTPLESLSAGLVGSTAVVYGAESVIEVARDLVKIATANDKLELKGACMEGEWYAGKAGVEKLSKFPTRVEAQSQLITLVLSPARKVMGCVKSPESRIMGIVKEIESRLEKGETISAAS
ncbi:MAG: 50S ribosomal protein L10 [Phycisphaerales bacterium]|nr:50S ribosomal protein L10 [Phycisphaerales bacterium]